jgi:hypothetical protein
VTLRTGLAAALGVLAGFVAWIPVSYLIALAFYLIDSAGGAAHELWQRLEAAEAYGLSGRAVLLPGDWFSLDTLAVFCFVGGLSGLRYAQTVGRPATANPSAAG